VTMKSPEWFYCTTWRRPCDLFVEKACLCMFQLAQLRFQLI